MDLLAMVPVPGVAAAIIRNGQLDGYVCCGVSGGPSSTSIDENTVFEAASLSKPLFAHAVLQLVDDGCLSLDAPLSSYLPSYIPIDARASLITARHVLSHSAGLPNWRSADFPLKTYFEPGERFSYSGEGFLYLQKAVEVITHERIDAIVARLVFEPFAMARSDFVWNSRLNPNRAYPHDAFGRPALSFKPGEANVAWSAQTTAADFARFLLATLEGSRLKPETSSGWLRPQVEVRHASVQCLDPHECDAATGISWGLGWGLESDKNMFFHWGDNGPFTAYTVGSMAERSALVIFTNSASGFSIMPELVAQFLPGERTSLSWLDYARHDAPTRRLLQTACKNGIAAVWHEVAGADLEADELRWIAQGLSAAGREQDSSRIRSLIEERRSAGLSHRS